MKISKFFSVYPSLLKGVLFKFNPPKVPSLARSVHKPLKVPSLARSVLKPLKEPSLARSVPKPLSIFALRHVQCPSHFQSSLPTSYPTSCEVKKWKVKSEWSNFWVFDLYETFICLRAYLEQKPYGGKKVQKNFLMGLKFWWSWGSRFFFSKSAYSVRFLDFHPKL